jgi:hypothetical protein
MGLKNFQLDTVEHVDKQFYGARPVRRFLVADETGLGKSLVARGVIAKAIEHLQDDDSVERIDVVYVCSNSDIAQQNISRINVTGDRSLEFASRLTMLATHSRQLASNSGDLIKPVNLVSFTPGTSFDMGWSTGRAQERALLFLLLEPLLGYLDGYRRKAVVNLLRGKVKQYNSFAWTIHALANQLADGVDPVIARAFTDAVRGNGLLERFSGLMDEMGRKHSVPKELSDQVHYLIRDLRRELARVSVQTLAPDLVILDEFQRFRHLLDKSRPEGALAHDLFDYGDARVLLLSATPYKPFTYAEEHDDDHHRDFRRTLEFLAEGAGQLDADAIMANLDTYRRAAVTSKPVADVARQIREQLLTVMCRTERPRRAVGGMLTERTDTGGQLDADDLAGYVALRRLAQEVDGQFSVEYWKSAPYFLNFCDGYQLAERLRRELKDPERAETLRPLVARTCSLDPDAIRAYKKIDYGNARLRGLGADTVDANWWRLLWIPPSLRYLTPGGPYAEDFAEAVTKRLIFSSWAATPTAIASLLSYEADRRTSEGHRTENTPEARRRLADRLSYRLDYSGRPAAMSALALFWPMPGLAALSDPLRFARVAGEAIDPAVAEERLAAELANRLPAGETSDASASEAWYWAAALRIPGALPDGLRDEQLRWGMGGHSGQTGAEIEDPAGLTEHVARALHVIAGAADLDGLPLPPQLGETVARLGMHSPGNVAWRALGRLVHGQGTVTAAGQWRAAALIADALRTLFRRPETTFLLDTVCEKQVYWREVLQYCAHGNLQAVLDEYLHHLIEGQQTVFANDDQLIALAQTAANAIALRPSTYEAFNPMAPDDAIRFTSRFSLRYGGKRQDEENARQPEVRQAFNSPFWPFVLATTSVGQEGIDFHWWSHSIMHWNTPANPVDFEQREGRVDRYAGHAVRRNIAARHGGDILRSEDPDPWCAAYRIASDETHTYGEFAPHWVYPGPAHIERHVAPYPLSADITRFSRLKEDLALYRLTFGQPRQEDMLEILRHRAIGGKHPDILELGLSLSPPRIPGRQPN